MAIATQIEALTTDKTNIANAITNKGGTVNTGDGFDNFATDIGTIPTGITPTGTINITDNGTHNVTNYASANVKVPETTWTPPHTTNGVWSFPSDEWSITGADNNIELISVEDDEEVLYYLVDCRDTDCAFISLRIYGQALCDYGTCNNGVYTAISATETVTNSQYYRKWLGDLGYDTLVVRIRNDTGYHITQCFLAEYNVSTDTEHRYSIAFNPILMRYGCAPYSTNLCITTYSLESDNVKNFASQLTNTALTMSSMYTSCYYLTRWRHTGWGIGSDYTNYTTRLDAMFSSCRSLVDVDNMDFSYWCSSHTTNLASMFNSMCHSVFNINVTGWDLTNVTTIASMFYNCYNIDVTGLDTWTGGSNITTTAAAFFSCYAIREVDLTGMTFSNKLTNPSNMFSGCWNVETIELPDMDFTNVTTTTSMFNSCRNLKTLTHGTITPSTTKLTSASSMFNNCYSLSSIDFIENWDLSKANVVAIFNYLYSLESTDDIDLTGVTWPTVTQAWGSSCIFNYCTHAKKIDHSMIDGSLDTGYGSTQYTCYSCALVEDFYPPVNMKAYSFSIGSYQRLTEASLVRIFNALPTVTSTYKLTLGTPLLMKLTNEEKAIATGKGWTLA